MFINNCHQNQIYDCMLLFSFFDETSFKLYEFPESAVLLSTGDANVNFA